MYTRLVQTVSVLTTINMQSMQLGSFCLELQHISYTAGPRRLSGRCNCDGVSCNWQCVLNRWKVLASLALGNSDLARVPTTFDPTAFGAGSTLGVGVYVVAGNVSKNIAGPAVVVSFQIVAIASVFAAPVHS